MKCRNMVGNNVVWFGKISGEEADAIPNYVDKEDGVAVSLKQHLSVIKKELWYQINYGIPLTDKYTSKTVMDSIILEIITKNPGVNAVTYYKSDIKNHVYTFDCTVQTIYSAELKLSNSYDV